MSRPGAGATAARPPALRTTRCRTIEEFRRLYLFDTPELDRRHAVEVALLPPGREPFELDGYCVVCTAPTAFRVARDPPVALTEAGGGVPNWREAFVCKGCGLSSRQRAAVHLLLQEAPLGGRELLYLTEQVTPLRERVRALYPASLGSEYLGPELAGGATIGGVRHEDLHHLSFPTRSLSAVLSLDVFEHLHDPIRALGEVYRCLRPGGALVLSVPFVDERYETQVRARRKASGEVEHLLAPEYHGDPLHPDRGVLV